MEMTMASQCCRSSFGALPATGAKAAARGGAPRAAMLRMSTHGAAAQGRNWRVYAKKSDESATGLYATVEKAKDTPSAKDTQRFGSSEAPCDEGSSFLAVESVLDSEGGKSKEDYKLRAHIFSESADFFSALKDRNSHVQ